MTKLEHIYKSFDDLEVLRDISPTAKEGKKLVVTGLSGSDENTIVRCINFLEEPTAGQVFIDGTELTVKDKDDIVRKNITIVFQQSNLYPHTTALQDITLTPIELQHMSKQDAEKIAYEYLNVVGLCDGAYVYPTTLSDGQQQRVAIAQALATKQKIILFDEPTSVLDPETVQEIPDAMIQLFRISITMVAVIYKVGFAQQMADRILSMNHGATLEGGKPEHFFGSPTNGRAKAFLSKILE